MLDLKPWHLLFTADLGGVDAGSPIDDATRDAIAAAMDEYAVLALHGQRLDDAQHMAVTDRFGPLEPSREADRPNRRMRIGNRCMIDVSNAGIDGKAPPADTQAT